MLEYTITVRWHDGITFRRRTFSLESLCESHALEQAIAIVRREESVVGSIETVFCYANQVNTLQQAKPPVR